MAAGAPHGMGGRNDTTADASLPTDSAGDSTPDSAGDIAPVSDEGTASPLRAGAQPMHVATVRGLPDLGAASQAAIFTAENGGPHWAVAQQLQPLEGWEHKQLVVVLGGGGCTGLGGGAGGQAGAGEAGQLAELMEEDEDHF